MTKRENYNEYMASYMLKRYHIRRNNAIEPLGGKCVLCGSSENLELDHKDPKDKAFSLAKLWSCAEPKYLEEIAKCQLLCRTCHEEKTINDLGFKRAKGNHGTISTHRYCRCNLCKEAWNKYGREHKAKKKLKCPSAET